jgi:hypothetical protein
MLRLSIASLFLLASAVQAQEIADIPEPVRSTVELLVERGLGNDVGYHFVRDLKTEVGLRLAGSEAEARSRTSTAFNVFSARPDSYAIKTRDCSENRHQGRFIPPRR